jgi:putative ABC transport system permease protein
VSLPGPLRALGFRLRALLGRDALDRSLEQEMRFHLESLIEEGRRAGLSEEEARRDARLRFGNPLSFREASRELLSFGRLESLAMEVRHAARRLRRAPGFTAVALVTLALGLGVNSALFAVLDVALLRPLPYPEPDRLVALWEIEIGRGERGTVALANLGDYSVPAFESLAASTDMSLDLTDSGEPETILGQGVGPRFFEVLGVGPVRGRAFLEEELRDPGAGKVVILSHRLFSRRFAEDPGLLGRTVRLDGEPHRVVGVLGPDFRAPRDIGARTSSDFIVPLALPPEIATNRGDHEVNVVGRLRPEASLAQARQQLEAVGQSLAQSFPDTNGEVRPRIALLHDDLARAARPSLLLLVGAVGAALLIACLNLSNLLLVRSLARTRETAVRVALGAGRAQALRGILVEAGLLALVGSALGLLVAHLGLRVAVALAPAAVRAAEARLDGRVLAFSLFLAGAVALVSALLPARLVSHLRPHESLRSLERSLAAAPTLRFGRALLVAEVALSLVLLVGGGLLLRSLARLHAVDVGFETERVLATSVNLPEARYPDEHARLRFFVELERRVGALPGVAAVAFANRFPLRGGWSTGIEPDSPIGASPGEHLSADAQAVSLRYFETLGIPLRRGRTFTAADREGAAPVAVVNEAFAARYYPGEEALGRRFRRGRSAPWVEIVGVVADLRRNGQAAKQEPGIYFAAAQTSLYPVHLGELAVRSGRDLRALAAALPREVLRLDPEQPMNRVLTLRESLERDLLPRRFAGILLSSFAGLALVLALVGVYGVTSYSVSRRTGELGLRLALGATPAGLLRLILGETSRRLALGVALGVAGALALTRLLGGLLFETTPTDPATFLATAAGFAAAGLLAAAVPAWRATRLDPTVTLRAG